MIPDNTPTPDYAVARNYAVRVLAHPDQYGTEEVAVARLLQHLLPAPTLAEMTTDERSATIGMWATIDPGDGSRAWRGIITRANRSTTLVCRPADLRVGLKPSAAPADTVTPDAAVPRAWNANGDPARPESGSNGDEKSAAAPAAALPDGWLLAVHEKYGSIIVTALPSDSDDRAFFVHPDFEDDRGFDWQFCDPDELTYVGTDEKPATAPAVEVGDIIESADDPRFEALPVDSVLLDRDGVTLTKREKGRWAGFGHAPIPPQGDEFGPWTVRRIGLVADQ